MDRVLSGPRPRNRTLILLRHRRICLSSKQPGGSAATLSSGSQSSIMADPYGDDYYGDWDSPNESGDEESQDDEPTDEALSSYNGLDPDIASSPAGGINIPSSPSGSESSSVDGSLSSEDKSNRKIMAARAYQLEMLEESLKRNIIVAVGCLTPVLNQSTIRC